MKTSHFTAAILLLLFLQHTLVFSQKKEFINGILLDAKTVEPVVFATVRIKDKSLGVISNQDGGFKIPVRFGELGDSLVISSMGYQNLKLLISDLNLDRQNRIFLTPAVIELQEAVVIAKTNFRRNISPKSIVKKAIEAIPKNYPLKPFSTIGYYRDYQMEKEQYINLNEAVLEVFDAGFKQIDSATTESRIYDCTQNQRFRRDTLADDSYDYSKGQKTIVNAFLSGYGGNEFSILKTHDAIRNYQLNSYDFINGMKDGDILKNHSFEKLSDTYLGNEPLYVIGFEKKTSTYTALGKMYISKNDFAIHKLKYEVYDNLRKNKNNELIKRGIKGKLIFEVTTEYKRNLNDKMYLNYISFHNTFQLSLPPKFTFDFIRVDIDMKRFELTFNQRIDSINALDYSNYEGFFKKKKIKFKSLLVLENQVFLYPNLSPKKEQFLWDELNLAIIENTLNTELVNFEVKNIKDVDGNLINEPFLKEYNQFREFFVQEVKPNKIGSKKNMYMKKRQPIFENQPISKPDNFGDYWMNTPLQKPEN